MYEPRLKVRKTCEKTAASPAATWPFFSAPFFCAPQQLPANQNIGERRQATPPHSSLRQSMNRASQASCDSSKKDFAECSKWATTPLDIYTVFNCVLPLRRPREHWRKTRSREEVSSSGLFKAKAMNGVDAGRDRATLTSVRHDDDNPLAPPPTHIGERGRNSAGIL